MGMEIQVDSLEDMCFLMCDNVIPEGRRIMTREEAINIMKVIVHMLEEKYDTDRVEDAVDMAIKALQDKGHDRKKAKRFKNKYLKLKTAMGKIRAEIADLDDAEYEFEGYYKAVNDALQIIDKYKAESEET